MAGSGRDDKTEISHWTSNWFDRDSIKQRVEFIEGELQRQWKELLKRLEALLSSADAQAPGAAQGAESGGGAAGTNA